MGFVISYNLNNASVITWVLPNLYIIVKSYSKNNNNHSVIFLETYGLLTKYDAPPTPQGTQMWAQV